jgi:hypothetical protein
VQDSRLKSVNVYAYRFEGETIFYCYADAPFFCLSWKEVRAECWINVGAEVKRVVLNLLGSCLVLLFAYRTLSFSKDSYMDTMFL